MYETRNVLVLPFSSSLWTLQMFFQLWPLSLLYIRKNTLWYAVTSKSNIHQYMLHFLYLQLYEIFYNLSIFLSYHQLVLLLNPGGYVGLEEKLALGTNVLCSVSSFTGWISKQIPFILIPFYIIQSLWRSHNQRLTLRWCLSSSISGVEPLLTVTSTVVFAIIKSSIRFL